MDRRIVDQHVQPAERIDRAADRRRPGGFVTHVQPDVTRRLPQIGDRGAPLLVQHIATDHLGAPFDEEAGRAPRRFPAPRR